MKDLLKEFGINLQVDEDDKDNFIFYCNGKLIKKITIKDKKK